MRTEQFNRFDNLKKITFEISIGLERKFDDISQTKGTPFVSGTNGNSTPVNKRN